MLDVNVFLKKKKKKKEIFVNVCHFESITLLFPPYPEVKRGAGSTAEPPHFPLETWEYDFWHFSLSLGEKTFVFVSAVRVLTQQLYQVLLLELHTTVLV